MNNLKISVIVPVYKAEAYLHRCVDSLLKQTFQDYEILLIDDGSPDNSGAICEEYAKKDHRVRVFHKENGGVSSARQCGMDYAQGEYTIHADPDDWVEPTMLEELYAKAKEEDADMVLCDFYEEYENKQIYKQQRPSNLDNQSVFRDLFQKLYGSCWNKLVRRVCFEKYALFFPKEMNLWEDLYVVLNLTMHPIKIAYLPKAFYHYDLFTNVNSIVRHQTLKDLESMKFFISSIEKKIDNHLFKDEIDDFKYQAKSLAFKLDLPYGAFFYLYSDVNQGFIKKYLNGENIIDNRLRIFMALCLKYNYYISAFLRRFYLLYSTMKRKIRIRLQDNNK